MTSSSKIKAALVTGAGRGIGRALVDVLRSRGHMVLCVVRNETSVTELVAVGDKQIVPILADITKPESEQAIKDSLTEHTAVLDLLVNNAGYGASNYGIEGLQYEELDKVLAVHCYGPIRVVRACLPFLRKSSSPAIINISSRFGSLEWVANGTVPHDQATYAYRIAKAALNMLTSCLAVELQAENIKVLAVDPGKVKTRFGPRDADMEPAEAAVAIADLAETNSRTGLFLSASGEKVPW